MSLSVASNAARYGKPIGYGPASLSAVSLVADAPQRSSAARSWTWKPPSTGSGRRDARLSNLMAILSQLPGPDPDATAPSRGGQAFGDDPGSSSSTGPAQGDAADLLQTLNDNGAAPPSPVLHASQGRSSELDPLPGVTPALPVGSSTQDVSEDPSVSAVAAQLEALFKTLQAYGL